MIYSKDGVISTSSDDNIQHMAWQDVYGEWQNCQTPANLHYDAEGELLSCEEASKQAHLARMGSRTLKRIAPLTDFKGPINLPR